MKIEDIIFLGAGASVSEGAPLQSDLFKEYFLSYQTERERKIDNNINKSLLEFFEAFFGIDIKHQDLNYTPFPTFEETLGMLEIALNREESFKDYSLTPNKPRLQRVREDLIFLIAITLNKKLYGKEKYHKKLVDRLKKKQKLLKTGFVSLNYDILIDNALVDLHPKYDLDYCVDFTNYEKPGSWKRPNPKKAVCLYKLHGSLNWLYCPTCISLTLYPKEKRAAKLVFKPEKCDICGSEMIPIIIPPTFFKVMSNYYLQMVWRKAENALKQAKRIFFCGYSFPDADIHIKYIIKRVEINRGITPEIFIINNHEEKLDAQRKNERLRYKRFFKDMQKVHYTYQSFENFCERGIDDR